MSRRWSGSLTWSRPRKSSCRASGTSCWPGPARRYRSSPTQASRPTWSPTARPCTPWPTGPRTSPPPSRPSPTASLAGAAPQLADLAPPAAPTGTLDVTTLAAAVGATLPENAIVVNEAQTSSLGLPAATANAARHDWITETGGAIGQGLPCALGAAVAAPDRPVLCLQADGSALYTLQALWTMARERANVTTILIRNDAYAILRLELQRVGAGPAGEAGPAAKRMLDLSDPSINHAAIAEGFGVDAVRVSTADELVAALRRAYAEPGPHLIEAAVPSLL